MEEEEIFDSFIDSHCHIPSILEDKKINLKLENYLDFEKDVVCKLAQDLKCKFKAVINVSAECISSDIQRNIKLLEYPNVYGTFGCHPYHAELYNEDFEKQLIEACLLKKSLAWGECGLDYFNNKIDVDIQKKVFKRQLEIAVELKKPLVVHSRDAADDTYDLMTKILPDDHKIHVHCYTYEGQTGIDYADKLFKKFKNLFLGFTGAITFKKSDELRKVVENVPLERILLETDAPFMAPGKFRGKVCHSGMIPIIAQQIADCKKVSLSKVLKTTYDNTCYVYGLNLKE